MVESIMKYGIAYILFYGPIIFLLLVMIHISLEELVKWYDRRAEKKDEKEREDDDILFRKSMQRNMRLGKTVDNTHWPDMFGTWEHKNVKSNMDSKKK